MEFSEFAHKLYSAISGGKNTVSFTRELFEAIVDKTGLKIVDEVKDYSFKNYFNGNNSISGIAKKINTYVDSEKFETYLDSKGDAAGTNLANIFRDDIPDAEAANIDQKLADLFVSLITEAAGSIKVRQSKTKNKSKKELSSAIQAYDNIIRENSRTITKKDVTKQNSVQNSESVASVKYDIGGFAIWEKKSDGKVVLEYNNTDKRLNRRNLEIINIIIEHSIKYNDYISTKMIVDELEKKGSFGYDQSVVKKYLLRIRNDSAWGSVLLHSADGYMIDTSAIAEISYGSYTKYCLYSDENLPKYYNLSYGDSFIGRDTRKTQFCICDSSLNMLHAKLTVTENEIWIYDINSTNGTYVNEQRISDCIQIHVGDRIRFGNVEYILKEIAGVLVSGTDTKIIEYGINIVGRESFTKKADDNINISIDSESVSLLHAIITAKAGHVSVRDLNSANGTFVNGNRIFGDTLIHNENTISFAGSEYVFRTYLD